MNRNHTSFAPSALLLGAALVAGCGRQPAPADANLADAGLLDEIGRIQAIDNHAHPVRIMPAGAPPDREFDALPVDNMEPQSDPVNLRPGSALVKEAAQALYG